MQDYKAYEDLKKRVVINARRCGKTEMFKVYMDNLLAEIAREGSVPAYYAETTEDDKMLKT